MDNAMGLERKEEEQNNTLFLLFTYTYYEVESETIRPSISLV